MTPARKALAVSALIGGALLGAIIASLPPVPIPLLRQSHILFNVPSRWHFARLLRLAISEYLADDDSPVVLESVALLRDEPTQLGVALPKYYVWVQARSAHGTDLSGVARVAAVDRERFDVVQYRTCEELLSDPETAAAIFPDALRERISEHVAKNCPAAAVP